MCYCSYSKNSEISFKIFDPSKALKLEDRERVKQIFGDYIYDNLDKENYMLSPNKAIQDELTKKVNYLKVLVLVYLQNILII